MSKYESEKQRIQREAEAKALQEQLAIRRANVERNRAIAQHRENERLRQAAERQLANDRKLEHERHVQAVAQRQVDEERRQNVEFERIHAIRMELLQKSGAKELLEDFNKAIWNKKGKISAHGTSEQSFYKLGVVWDQVTGHKTKEGISHYKKISIKTGERLTGMGVWENTYYEDTVGIVKNIPTGILVKPVETSIRLGVGLDGNNDFLGFYDGKVYSFREPVSSSSAPRLLHAFYDNELFQRVP